MDDEVYRELFENVADGLVLHDPATGEILDVNRQYCEMNGYDRSELVGADIGLVSADDPQYTRTEALDRIREAREDGPLLFEWRHVDRDGREFPVEVHLSTVELDGNVRVLASVRDVSDAESIRQEHRQLAEAVRHAASAIFITDADGTIEYVNPAFEELTGYTGTDAIGRTPKILKSGQMDDAYYERLYETITSGEVWEQDIVDRRASGELYYAHQTIAPILDRDGAIDGYVAVQTDVTQYRIKDQILNVLHRLLRHNLRNKLTVIEGRADELQAAVDDPELETIAAGIFDATARLREVSEKGMTASEVMAEDPATRPIDLSALVADEQSLLADVYPTATLDIDVPDGLYVQGDDALAVAIHELMENAIKHGDEPTVKIAGSMAADGVTIELTVADDGPGIEPTEWQPIETGEETPLDHATGVGLWLTEWTVSRLGGTLDIRDRDPEGTIARICLPHAERD
ncbi:PAS domain S-box protein [Halorientalis salina]|uniref:PAS domain S-box protein n=1 Tax=Halorientalis salina TaxID=2932266 RepID=UPI0010AD3CB3|nr:PAS domain S-box protein [Halorientalis salina]